MKISCITTQSDWASMFGNWGFPGVKFILDRCKTAGMKKVYWRVTDGGRMMYHSKIAEIEAEIDDNEGARHFYGNTGYTCVDYRGWDPLKTAVDYAHKIGLELHAWMQVCEEDHPWGLLSRFAKENPQFLSKDRQGRDLRAHLGFAYPEVVEYKLALIREVLKYGVDGFLLDFVRFCGNTVPLLDEQGVALYGYERPAVEAFERRYGVAPTALKNNDPGWVKFRASYITDFVRKVSLELKKQPVKVPLGTYIPWKNSLRTWWDPAHDYQGNYQKAADYLKSWFYDVEAWAGQKLIDYICPDVWVKNGGGWKAPAPGLIKRIASYFRKSLRLSGDIGLCLSYYAWGTKPGALRKGAQAAFENGFDELILCESQGVERTTNYWLKPWDEVARLNKSLSEHKE